MAAQRMRYSAQELSLIKATFAEQEEAMVLIRKFLLQGEMTPEETNLLNRFSSNESTMALLRKAVNPTLDKLATRFQTVDLMSSLDFTPTPMDHGYLIIKSREKAAKYLNQQFAAMTGAATPKAEFIDFDKLSQSTADKEETFVNVMTRNFLLSHIDSQLFNQLMVLAGTKEETPEEQQKRLQKDSNK